MYCRHPDPGGFSKHTGAKRLEEDPDIDPYNDLFCDLLEENAQAHPKYQGDCGDWLNWTVPDTDCNLPIFSSGWGDGYYPVYFGYDAKGEVCAVYVRFIDIEASYKSRNKEARYGITKTGADSGLGKRCPGP